MAIRRILRSKHVLDRRGDAKSTLWEQVNDGTFPPPIKIGCRAVGWVETEVEAVIAARIAGRSDEEIRNLVAKLVAARRETEIEALNAAGIVGKADEEIRIVGGEVQGRSPQGCSLRGR